MAQGLVQAVWVLVLAKEAVAQVLLRGAVQVLERGQVLELAEVEAELVWAQARVLAQVLVWTQAAAQRQVLPALALQG